MTALGTGGCPVLEDLRAKAYAACLPIHVSVEITLRCNARCPHCYNFDREAPRGVPPPELAFDEIRTLMGDLRAAGTLFLSLTGGEPMTHPRFWDLMDEAARRLFAVAVLSNGTLLTREACDRLAGYANLWSVGLSLYGARSETHDRLAGIAGAFQKALDGARRLRERGVNVLFKFIVFQANSAEVSEMMALADRLGIAYSIDTTITGRYDGTRGSLDARVDHATLETLYRGPLRHLLSTGKSDPTDDEFKCACARANAAVSAIGDVYPCIAAPIRAGNIREQGFGEIWKNSPLFQRIRGLRVLDFKQCAPCLLKSWCRHTPGAPTALRGDYTGVDPWVCQEAEILRRIQSEG